MRLIDFCDAGRYEPRPGLLRPLAEFAEASQLDASRGEFYPDPQPSKRRLTTGPIGSVLLHLLALLAIVEWPKTPIEMPVPIPVQLVIERPPPPQPSNAKPPVVPPHARLASDDFAEVTAPKVAPATGSPPPDVGEAPPQAAETAAVLVAPPSPPAQPSVPIPPDRQPNGEPLPRASQTAMLMPPTPPRQATRRPPRATMRLPKPDDSEWPLPLYTGHANEARRSAPLLGPAAIRDEYCARAFHMTMRHIDLLPLSLVAARQGETQVAIRVLGDGTIGSVRVARSSGYPDIDERIERMVVAVGRFPPLPQWMGPWMDFIFQLHFPDPSQR